MKLAGRAEITGLGVDPGARNRRQFQVPALGRHAGDDPGQHISHAKNARSHPFGMKQLEGIELFSHPNELDRFVRHGFER